MTVSSLGEIYQVLFYYNNHHMTIVLFYLDFLISVALVSPQQIEFTLCFHFECQWVLKVNGTLL